MSVHLYFFLLPPKQLDHFPTNLTIPSLPSFNKLDQKRLEVRRQNLQHYLKEVTSNKFIRIHPKAVSHLVLFLTEGHYTRSKTELTRMVGVYTNVHVLYATLSCVNTCNINDNDVLLCSVSVSISLSLTKCLSVSLSLPLPLFPPG